MSLNAKAVGFIKQFTAKDGTPTNRIIIDLPVEEEYDGNPSHEHIQVAHDYVRFYGSIGIEQESQDGGKTYPVPHVCGAQNWTHVRGSVTIQIRDMFDIVLPFLNAHPHLQKEHFQTRDPDTKDAYEPYAYSGAIIYYRDPKTKMNMVSFRRRGETHWETVSLELWKTIKDTLKLNKTASDLLET